MLDLQLFFITTAYIHTGVTKQRKAISAKIENFPRQRLDISRYFNRERYRYTSVRQSADGK
jgi:hypothetical protein